MEFADVTWGTPCKNVDSEGITTEEYHEIGSGSEVLLETAKFDLMVLFNCDALYVNMLAGLTGHCGLSLRSSIELAAIQACNILHACSCAAAQAAQPACALAGQAGQDRSGALPCDGADALRGIRHRGHAVRCEVGPLFSLLSWLPAVSCWSDHAPAHKLWLGAQHGCLSMQAYC